MKKYMIAIGFLLLNLFVFAACAAEETLMEEPVKPTPLKLESMKMDTVEYTYVAVGEVVPKKQVDIYIGGGGYIEKIMVELGDLVEADMLLVQLDGSEVDMSNYNATESQLRTVRENLSSQLNAARDNYDRQLSLVEGGVITALELEQSRLQVENLEREYDNAKSTYRNQLAIIKDGLDDAVDSRIIRSEVEGIIAGLYIEEGEQANGQLGMSLIDGSDYYIQTSVSGDLVKAISEGDSVRLRLDGREDQVTMGKIVEIEKLPDLESKLYEVRLSYEDLQEWILGDYVEIEFVLERYEALMVPTASVVRKGEEKFIYTYDLGELSQVMIETGRSKGAWVEVKNLDDLTDVVVNGQNQLQSEGSPFLIVE